MFLWIPLFLVLLDGWHSESVRETGVSDRVDERIIRLIIREHIVFVSLSHC